MKPEAEENPVGVRVAVVIPTHWDYRMGGSQYQAKLLIEKLHSDHAAKVRYFAARAGESRQFADHDVVAVGESNALRRFGHFWDYFRLQRALEEFAPDVIYQRVGSAYTGIAATYARRHGVPLIWHLASQGDCQKPPPLLNMLGRPHKLIETRLAAKGAAGADVVVAQSKDQARMMRDNFARQPDAIIGNFHDVPPATEKRSNPVRVVWIANLKPIKRPELFLEIAARLADQANIEFLMIGGAYSHAEKKRQFDETLRNCKNVRYLGAMPGDEVNKWLEESHLLVNTSISEGFSNTFIQAWMRSVPVLTLGVNPDGLLTDNFLGRCHNSTAEIANSIRELADGIAILKDMGKQSRNYAVQHFSMENATELADLVVRTAVKNRSMIDGTLKN